MSSRENPLMISNKPPPTHQKNDFVSLQTGMGKCIKALHIPNIPTMETMFKTLTSPMALVNVQTSHQPQGVSAPQIFWSNSMAFKLAAPTLAFLEHLLSRCASKAQEFLGSTLSH